MEEVPSVVSELIVAGDAGWNVTRSEVCVEVVVWLGGSDSWL